MSEQYNPVIVTITGPSASGKTVLSRLLGDEFVTLVSTTTRAPRSGEIQGKDYHFVSEEKFLTDLENGKFMEDVNYNGVFYGVSILEATKAFAQNKPAVLVAEPHGVEQIAKFCRQKNWNVLRVFVDNDETLLLGRLLNRLRQDLTGVNHNDQVLPEISTWTDRLNQLIMSDPDNTSLRQEKIKSLLEDFIVSNGLPMDPTSVQKIEDSAKRLKSFEFEQKNWVIPARTTDLYDYVTGSFNQNVQQDVVNEILKRVHQLQENSPSSHVGTLPAFKK